MNDGPFYNEILNILGPFAVSRGAEGRILLAYNEPWRTYHNSDHIMQMLELSRCSNIDLSNEERQCLELMILYHDVWYKVGRPAGENERRSADWFSRDLCDLSRKATALRRAVKQGIIATTTHSLDNINPDYVEEIGTLLDLDLWGLGQTPDIFKANTEKVWREYQPIMTREKFDAGRSAWARSFLDSRDRIYHTEPFLHLEEMAQRNLRQLVQ